MNIYIYCLKDPDTYEIKYIGKTISLDRRFKEHLQIHRNRRSKKNSWIISLINKGLQPIMEVVEICSKDNWEVRECYWIQYYIDLGFNLKNTQKGGGRLEYVFSKESRDKMSKSSKLRWSKYPSKNGKKVLSKSESEKRSINAKENPKILKNLKKGSLSCRIEIIQLSKEGKLIKEWDSLSDASRGLSINVGNIHKCLTNKTKTCGGFTWKYKSDVSNNANSMKPEAHPIASGVGG